MMSEQRKASAENMLFSTQHPEAVSELDKLASAYFSASDVGLCIVDSGLHYIAINKTLAEMNGVSAEDHLGRTPRDVLGDLGGPLEKKISEVLETPQPSQIEISGKLPSRTENVHRIVHYLPITNALGTVTSVGGVILEVSAPRFLEESLQKLNRQLHDETSRLQMLPDGP